MNNKFYGIVEGFFSRPLKPWSMKERLDTIEFISQKAPNLTTYFYCPKDDPYVTKKWDIQYPEGKMSEFGKLINTCNLKKIRFAFGLNPTTDLLSKDKLLWRKKVISKLKQFQALGIRTFCILFDDIPVAYDVLDKTLKRDTLYDTIVEQMNALYMDLGEDIDDLWLCTPDYNFNSPTPLTSALKKLDKRIAVFWSGNKVFSKEITPKDISRVRKIVTNATRLLYWSNYPVNDCEQNLGVYNLGSFWPLTKQVVQELDGIMVNPMRECYANFPFLSTFSQWINDPKGYNRNNAWKDALARLGITSQDTVEILSCFSSANVVDPQKSFSKKLYRKIIDGSIGSTATQGIRNSWGRLFINTLSPLFVDFKFFSNVVQKVYRKEKILAKDIALYDLFPTKPYIARYMPEVLKIVRARYNTYCKYSTAKLYLENELKIVRIFEKKYSGSAKLNISRIDKLVAKDVMRSAIQKEQASFRDYLNEKKSAKKKTARVFQRRLINRFVI